MYRFLLPVLFIPMLLTTSGCLFLRAAEYRDESLMLQQRVHALRQDKAVVEEELETTRRTVSELTRLLTQAREETTRAQQEAGEARVRLQQSTESIERQTTGRLEALEASERELLVELEQARDRVSSLEVELMALEDRLAESEERLETATMRLADLQGENENLTIRLDESEKKVASLEENLGVKTARVEELTESLTTTESDLRLARGQSEEKEATLATERERRTEMADRIEALEADLEKARTEVSKTEVPAELVEKVAASARGKLERQISSGNAQVQSAPGGVRIILLSDELFNTGTTVLSDTGKVLLAAAEDIIKESPHKRLVVQGHTDNQPIVRMPFPDNWELGAARASEVVRWLASRPGVESGKIVAQSHSSYAPIASNNTVEGRRQNRRVEILIELDGGG